MQNAILEKLSEIEKKYDVRILYAVESGSRAWGFESTDSDYDVRFIYAHPKEWYLQVFDQRDVIEEMYTVDGTILDVSGWDLRKTLKLMHASNPPLLEWLESPIVYVKDKYTYDVLQGLAKVFYANHKVICHYYHMARNNFNKYIQNRSKVWIKKYLYVLRPVLAAEWVRIKGTMPPMELSELMRAFVWDDNTAVDIINLIDKKRAGVELGIGDAIPSLTEFLDEKLKMLAECHPPAKYAISDHDEALKLLNDTFLNILGDNK